MYGRSGQLDCPTRHATFHIHLPKQQGPRCLKDKLEYLYMYLYFFYIERNKADNDDDDDSEGQAGIQDFLMP